VSDQPPAAASKSSLTVSKVFAGAGAAATTAVVGSMFGADGTVVGAAVGSVVSAVATATYERSLDRTRKMVVARVRPRGNGDVEITQVIPAEALAASSAEVTQVIPVQRPPGEARHAAGATGPTRAIGATDPTRALGATGPTRVTGEAPTGEPVAPVPPPRRTRLPLLAGATVVIFLVGLMAVTGIELFTGGPVLSSNHTQRSTSVGTVLGVDKSASTSTTAEATPTAAAESTAEATESVSPSATKKSGADATRSGSRSDEGSGASATPAPERRATAKPTPAAGLPALQDSSGG
jgi:hypothetical protein